MQRRIAELIRLEEDHRFGTFGVLRIDKRVFCCTLEPCDKENAQSISSIPAQQYQCIKITSPKFGPTYKVCDVPGREDILFHKGNAVGDTLGCILLGQYFGKLGAGRAVLNSGSTFKDFMAELNGAMGFHLTISEVF